MKGKERRRIHQIQDTFWERLASKSAHPSIRVQDQLWSVEGHRPLNWFAVCKHWSAGQKTQDTHPHKRGKPAGSLASPGFKSKGWPKEEGALFTHVCSHSVATSNKSLTTSLGTCVFYAIPSYRIVSLYRLHVRRSRILPKDSANRLFWGQKIQHIIWEHPECTFSKQLKVFSI